MVQALSKKATARLKPLNNNPDAFLDFFSTGIPQLDLCLGGGYPQGRIIEVVGPEACGKTTLALHACAQAQKHGKVVFLDAEHSLSAEYAQAVGVDTDSLLFGRPKDGEETLQLTWDSVKAGVALVVIDSVAAMPTQEEMEGRCNSDALHDRLLSDGLKRICQHLGGKSETSLIVTNQIRDRHGLVFGTPERLTGGRSLGYYSSIRLDLRVAATLVKRGSKEYGIRVRFKTAKSKVTNPFQTAEADLIFGEGFAFIHSLFDLGEQAGIITRVGQKYFMDNLPIGYGRDAALDELKTCPDLRKAMEGKIAEWRKADL